ncbi:MAG: hypothetical protein ACI81P_000886 [Neolewinella sp.]|jgi:hypothetical protein
MAFWLGEDRAVLGKFPLPSLCFLIEFIYKRFSGADAGAEKGIRKQGKIKMVVTDNQGRGAVHLEKSEAFSIHVLVRIMILPQCTALPLII